MLVRDLPEVRNLGCHSTAKPAPTEQRKNPGELRCTRVWQGVRIESSETRVLDVPLPLFERRHFYRSELQEGGR